MAFDVILTRRAQLDIDEYTLVIANDSPTEAAMWKAVLENLIISLADMPERISLIPEASRLRFPYRSANHHSHRVIFRIDERASAVYIARVYHGARKPLATRDIPQDEI